MVHDSVLGLVAMQHSLMQSSVPVVIAPKLFVSLTCRLVAYSARIAVDRLVHNHMHSARIAVDRLVHNNMHASPCVRLVVGLVAVQHSLMQNLFQRCIMSLCKLREACIYF